jgi:hypothetical protein
LQLLWELYCILCLHLPGICSPFFCTVQLMVFHRRVSKCCWPLASKQASQLLKIFLDTWWIFKDWQFVFYCMQRIWIVHINFVFQCSPQIRIVWIQIWKEI